MYVTKGGGYQGHTIIMESCMQHGHVYVPTLIIHIHIDTTMLDTKHTVICILYVHRHTL